MNNKITNFQLGCMIFFLSRSILFISSYSNLIMLGGSNTIVSMIIGTILGIMFIKFYYYLINYKVKYSKIIKILIILLLIFMLLYIIKKYTNFIIFNYLPTTNPFIITLSIILLVIYIIKNNIDTLYRSSEMFLYLFIFLFIISIIGNIKYVDINNIKPILNNNFIQIIKTVIVYIIATCTPIILITNFKIEKISKKVLTKSYLISCFILLINYISITGILSINLASIYTYPETFILKKISFFNFIERIENILSIQYLLEGIFLIIVIFYNIKVLSHELINNKKSNYLITIISVFILLVSNILNISNYYFYISLVLVSIIIPLLFKKKTI